MKSRLLLLFLLFGCGNHIIVSPYNYVGTIEFGEFPEELDLEEDFDSHKDIKDDRQGWSYFGYLVKPRVKVARTLKTINPSRKPIRDFTITTTYKWYDIIFHGTLVAAPRTVQYTGNYRSAREEESLMVDDEE